MFLAEKLGIDVSVFYSNNAENLNFELIEAKLLGSIKLEARTLSGLSIKDKVELPVDMSDKKDKSVVYSDEKSNIMPSEEEDMSFIKWDNKRSEIQNDNLAFAKDEIKMLKNEVGRLKLQSEKSDIQNIRIKEIISDYNDILFKFHELDDNYIENFNENKYLKTELEKMKTASAKLVDDYNDILFKFHELDDNYIENFNEIKGLKVELEEVKIASAKLVDNYVETFNENKDLKENILAKEQELEKKTIDYEKICSENKTLQEELKKVQEISLKKEIEAKNIRIKEVHDTIEKAIFHLQNTNFSDYFEQMDKVVPDHLRTQFGELQDRFITGIYTPHFSQQLKTFAKKVNKSL